MARRAAVDLLAQLADEHVDRPVAVGGAASPDALQQLVSGQDAARVERERVDEPELGRGQFGTLAVDVRLHVPRVEAELLDHDLLASTRSCARVPRRAAAPTRATSSFIENGFTR